MIIMWINRCIVYEFPIKPPQTKTDLTAQFIHNFSPPGSPSGQVHHSNRPREPIQPITAVPHELEHLGPTWHHLATSARAVKHFPGDTPTARTERPSPNSQICIVLLYEE